MTPKPPKCVTSFIDDPSRTGLYLKQVSMEMESGGVGGMSSTNKGPQPTFTNSAWQRRTRLERLLLAAIALLFVIVVIILAITITKVAK